MDLVPLALDIKDRASKAPSPLPAPFLLPEEKTDPCKTEDSEGTQHRKEPVGGGDCFADWKNVTKKGTLEQDPKR